MSTDTTITVDYLPRSQEEQERIAKCLGRLAERFGLWDADVNVWVSEDRRTGCVLLGSYGHKYRPDHLDTLARVLSRLMPADVRVEEEGDDDGNWGDTATYRAGRMIRSGIKEWVEQDVDEA